jgi:hypothetical protein
LHLYKPQLMQVLNIHLLELLIHHKHQHIHVFFHYIKDLVVFQQLHPKINFDKQKNIFSKNKITSNGNNDKAYSINTRIRRLE